MGTPVALQEGTRHSRFTISTRTNMALQLVHSRLARNAKISQDDLDA